MVLIAATSSDIFCSGFDQENIEGGEALRSEALATLRQEFLGQGWLFVPQVLSKREVESLRTAIERKYHDSRVREDKEHDYIRGVGLMRMFEYSRAFRDLIEREPLIGLVEAILGSDCHIISQNALRTPRNNGIVDWHIDGELMFEHLAQLNTVDARWIPPCFSLSVMIALSDATDLSRGPTQIVVGSHLSGRLPDPKTPSFEGAGPTTVAARAGDAYLLNHQLWHRGAQNTSDQVRYMAVTAYGRRFIQQRFFPFLNYAMPAHALVGASDRLLRLLGKHSKGPFG